MIINEIWNLPTERYEEVIVATLPPPKEIVPREKPIPKAKPMTKWEQYAKEKGIKKQKKSKMVWDDVVKEWVPRFGYKKAKAEVEKNWLMPYKGWNSNFSVTNIICVIYRIFYHFNTIQIFPTELKLLIFNVH